MSNATQVSGGRIPGSKEPAVKAFTGRHMLAMMLAFFGVIITVNMFMAYNAVSTWTGLVVKNSYVESQRFNDVTAERLAGERLGWKLDPAYAGGQLRLTLTGPDGEALRDAEITAKLGRPVHENEDRQITFSHQGEGIYLASAELAGGVWQADYTISRATGEIWQKSYRFLVKD